LTSLAKPTQVTEHIQYGPDTEASPSDELNESPKDLPSVEAIETKKAEDDPKEQQGHQVPPPLCASYFSYGSPPLVLYLRAPQLS